MNFMKPKRANIRYTNSQSLREDVTEVPVGRVAVPKTGQKNASARDNLYPMGSFRFPCARKHTPLCGLPLSAAIDLR